MIIDSSQTCFQETLASLFIFLVKEGVVPSHQVSGGRRLAFTPKVSSKPDASQQDVSIQEPPAKKKVEQCYENQYNS